MRKLLAVSPSLRSLGLVAFYLEKKTSWVFCRTEPAPWLNALWYAVLGNVQKPTVLVVV